MTDRWNVVLVLTDDQPTGDIAQMPYLDSRPEGHWVTFDQAVFSTAWCGPSRANILTGLSGSRSGVTRNDNTHLIEDWPTLAVPLADAGYHNALIGKYENLYPWGDEGFPPVWRPAGWHEWHAHVIASGQYYNYRIIEGDTSVSYGSTEADYVTDVLNAKAVDFIETAHEPFFCYLAHWAPHEAEIPAERHEGLYPSTEWTPPPNFNEADISDKPSWLAAEWPTVRNQTAVDDFKARRVNTWRTLRAVDEGVEDIVAALTARGCLDRTVIIFINDNGVMFGEHRAESKGVPYEENVRADLMIRWPGATQRTDSALVMNLDLPATICDLAGTVLPHSPDGMSLRPIFEEDIASENFRAAQVIEWFGSPELPTPPWRCLRTATAKYVEHFGGETEFYDLVTDPYELASDPTDPRAGQMAADLAAIEAGPHAPVLA